MSDLQPVVYVTKIDRLPKEIRDSLIYHGREHYKGINMDMHTDGVHVTLFFLVEPTTPSRARVYPSLI